MGKRESSGMVSRIYVVCVRARLRASVRACARIANVIMSQAWWCLFQSQNQEAEAEVQSQPASLSSEFPDSQDYIVRPRLKQNNKIPPSNPKQTIMKHTVVYILH